MAGTADIAAAGAASSKRLNLLVRIPLTIVGGYAVASALVSGLALSLPLLGMARSEAVVTASMLGFLIYLFLLLWGAADRRLIRLAVGYVALTALGVAPWVLIRAGS